MNSNEVVNPYEAPRGEVLVPTSFNPVRIEGKQLVLPKDWTSPQLCLFTGVTHPLTPARKAKLSWVNPLYLISILAGFLIYVLIALVAQKKGTIHYFLSESMAAQVKKRLRINWGIFGASVLMFSGASATSSGELAGVGVLVLLICLFLAVTWCRLLKVGKIDKTSIWLKGIPADVQQKIVQMDQARYNTPPLLPSFAGPPPARPSGW